jgi:hypothetical protein
MRTSIKRFFLGLALVAAAWVMPAFANAQTSQDSYAAYSAQEVTRSHTGVIDMKPGEVKEFRITFRNIGTEAWVNYGNRYVSVYTHNPEDLKYAVSEFKHPQWIDWNHPAQMNEGVVGLGQNATFTVKLSAPLATGRYTDTYRLAVEDLIWMPGGRFSIEMNVQGEAVVELRSDGTPANAPAVPVDLVPTPSAGSSAAVQSADGYGALMLIASARDLSLKSGESAPLRLGFKNIGDKPWLSSGAQPVTLKLASGSASGLDSAWPDGVAARLPVSEIKPGQLAFFDVSVAVPLNVSGSLTPRFQLMAGSALVDGGTFDLPMTVTSSPGAASGAVGTPSPSSAIQHLYVSDFAGVGDRGPLVRIGLLYSTDPVVVASSGAYKLVDGETNAVVEMLSGVTTVQFDWASKNYYVSNGGFSKVMAQFPKFVPLDYAANVFQVTSYESRAAWDPSYNFNQFRGTLEVRHTPATDRLWVIEELFMEDYLRGLAETSNESHFEYQKALVTAARTYAMYVLYIGGKHKSEFHDLVTDGRDQVYKGYLSELVRPNVARAVEETRGLVVSYNNELVVTPYFSRSDGRTRSWSEVWNGSKPWLVSVPAPYDAREGFELWGHGVGMSAMDAYYRAGEGWNWDAILKYYYTGIAIGRIY